MLTVVVGGFFGDEGKGKLVAYLGLADDVVAAVRVGSVNAGHTVVWKGVTYKLRLIPSAFVNSKTKLMIASGALVRKDVFLSEVEALGVRDRVFLDRHAGVIDEEHVIREREDPNLSGRIGSTLQGVGAAMADRVLRRLKLAEDYPELRPYLIDVSEVVNDYVDRGFNVLVEGTQGTFLSLYHGTYPYVTSRDTTSSAVLSEVGLGPKKVDEVVVVFKSFVTRVGEGPLDGELPEEEVIKRGLIERGTVTGRARRVAPFNLELAKKAIVLNSATQVAITKLDWLFPNAYGVKEWGKLPAEARRWVDEIEGALGVPITLIGTGEEVEHVIDRRRELGYL
ncbi:MAG: adenylosuccinate synthetase [Zestosphaera tikiterensis]|uniref:Adenylosuccinate synthetase n=1 Tax=Zestosphaera tikiterensis TaxID=1973259 RepID=A0A2R7Y5K2_9CREN|nr:MAG: adenylosuccinate synthetase [Zestosphaera tikiterensis]